MKPKFRSLIAAFAPLSRSSLIVVATLSTAWSQTDGTWTSDALGNWSDGLNWDAGAIAGSGGAADFSTIDIPAGTLVVTVDGAYDVSAMSFGDTDTATAGTWSVALGGNLTLSGGRTVTTAVTTAFTGAFGTQTSTDLLDKQGAGQLNLTGLASAWPGPMNLGAGTVEFKSNTSSKSTVAGALTGTGTVLVSQTSARTFTQESDISGFSGKFSCASGNFRYANGSGNPTAEQANGSQVTFDLGSGGNVLNRNGTNGTITIRLGELIGSTGSFLSGGNAVGSGQVLFQVGEKGVASTFGGGVRNGTTKSALTKSGAAKLTLSGSNTFTGATNIDGGILEVSSTGEITASASLTLQGSGSYTFFNNGGSAAFTGNVALANSVYSPLVKVTDGVFTAGSMSIGRGSVYFTSEPAQGPTTAGFYVTGTSDIDITSGISINGNNSTASARFDGGTVDVGGVCTIGIEENSGRWSVLDVNGAAFTSTDATTGIQIGSPTSDVGGNAIFLVRDGTATVEKITFNKVGTAALQGVARVNGGTLYIGSGGIGTTGSNTNFSTTLKLAGGVLGAKDDWTSAADVNVLLSGLPTIQAADSLDAPFDINISGILSGTGGFQKTGAGKLTLSGLNIYTGNTTVSAGTLEVTNDDVFDDAATVTIASGAILDLTHSGTDKVGVLIVNGETKPDGVYTFGTGKLQVGSSTPFETWASSKGLDGTAGKENGLADDPDKDGKTNLSEFAFNGNPLSGSDNGQVYVLAADSDDDVDTTKELILTLAVRKTTPAFTAGAPATAPLTDGITYSILGSTDLATFGVTVTPVGLVDPGVVLTDATNYEYRSFSLSGSNGLAGKGFLRAKVTSP